MILTANGLQIESYEDEEVLIEHTLANPVFLRMLWNVLLMMRKYI